MHRLLSVCPSVQVTRTKVTRKNVKVKGHVGQGQRSSGLTLPKGHDIGKSWAHANVKLHFCLCRNLPIKGALHNTGTLARSASFRYPFATITRK